MLNQFLFYLDSRTSVSSTILFLSSLCQAWSWARQFNNSKEQPSAANSGRTSSFFISFPYLFRSASLIWQPNAACKIINQPMNSTVPLILTDPISFWSCLFFSLSSLTFRAFCTIPIRFFFFCCLLLPAYVCAYQSAQCGFQPEDSPEWRTWQPVNLQPSAAKGYRAAASPVRHVDSRQFLSAQCGEQQTAS